MAKSNIKATPPGYTHEGGASKAILKPIDQLRRTVMTCLLFEGSFYEDGISISERIKELIKKCTFEEVAELAIHARKNMKLRHVPLFMTRELLRNYDGKKIGDLVAKVIQRPDELGELLAMYWNEGKTPLKAQLKIGLARAIKKFNEYELAKWNKDGKIKLRDVLFLCHAKPKDKEQEALFKKIANNTLITPDTWEVALSGGANKKEVFERLIKEKKLGAMALLKNLRLMLECNVDEDVIKQAVLTMKTEKILPFRFISAAKYAPRLEEVLEQSMFRCLSSLPKLHGKTAFLLDHSRSMKWLINSKSDINRFETAAGLAMILRESCPNVRFFTFSEKTVEIPARRGFALKEAAEQSMPWGGTDVKQAVEYIHKVMPDVDRIIILTDEQSATVPPHPKGIGYIINVDSNKNGIGYGSWTTISGWSEAILEYIYNNELKD